MTKANKRISRTRTACKALPEFPISPAVQEFHDRWRRHVDLYFARIPGGSRKAARAIQAREADRAEFKAYVANYLARFYKGDDFLSPKQLKTTAEIVELAVAGIDSVMAARALCVAITRMAGLKLPK